MTWGPGEGAPDGTACESVGITLSMMKTQLKPGSKSKAAGAFYGKDLAWWRSHTRDILHPSVLAFDPDADAKEWLGKLRAIRDAPVEERRRRIEGGEKKEGWIEVVEVSGEGSRGGGATVGSRRRYERMERPRRWQAPPPGRPVARRREHMLIAMRLA